ncbi:DUF6841 family protein [Nocardia xishanensis]|uniref:DUF6841 family protein n=1 Tax=Nocardia xishanensis TaxID=238964 RepID=UPI00082C18B1|nr:hypothetical protein [Nocardia xishanensis]
MPDRRVTVYNAVGATIEVIWSRRRADESEIRRWAVHFEVAKSVAGWRVIAVQAIDTAESALEEIFASESPTEVVGRG